MHEHVPPDSSLPGRLRFLVLLVAVAGPFLGLPAIASAAELTLEAKPMLGGHVRLGTWAGLEVRVRNDGPPISGELRLVPKRQGASTYSTAVELPTTSDKRFVLYAQPSVFRTDLEVVLVSGGRTVASTIARVTTHDAAKPMIGIVAERADRLVGDIAASSATAVGNRPEILTLRPADLAPRAEAWMALDAIIWQDIDAGELSNEQRAALENWLAAGGRLIVLGGSTGAATLARFPQAVLPYRPESTVDVKGSDLRPLVGAAAPGGSFPAVGGTLLRGTVLATSGNQVIAADAGYGSGEVTFVGFDLGQTGLSGSPAARAIWSRALGSAPGRELTMGRGDEGSLLSALNRLPNAELPKVDQLFGLLAGYIVLVGPLNYLVLRRLDRREWAWITIPALVIAFAVGTYALGRAIKGNDVIVNQLSIVRTPAGSETGLAQSYVAVFSPSRQKYDVRVDRSPLVSTIAAGQDIGITQAPLDVVAGETTRVRGYQLGYGAVRGFRAEAAVPAPAVEATLRFSDGELTGEIRNRSNRTLEGAAVVFGNGLQVLGSFAPGESRSVKFSPGGNVNFGMPLADRLFGSDNFGDFSGARPADQARFARRALAQQISYSDKFGARTGVVGPGSESPLLLAWASEGVLPVQLDGQSVQNIGQTLYLVPLPATVQGRVVFTEDLIRSAIVEANAPDLTDQGIGFSMGKGSLVAEYRALAMRGRFEVSELVIGVSQGDQPGFAGPAPEPIRPRPDQPPQNDPVGAVEDPPQLSGPPALQLFDRASSRWVEFASLAWSRNYSIANPERYVSASGSFLVRFVVRGEPQFFRLSARMTGAVR